MERARNGDSIEPRVIDPAVDPRPLLPEDWIPRFALGPMKLDLVERAQYAPPEYEGRQRDFEANIHHARTLLEECRELLAALWNVR